MVMTDPIADMLTRMRNAAMVSHQEVKIPHSKLKEEIVNLLKEEGYIKNFRVVSEGNHKNIIVYLKYTESGSPVIRGMKKVSKPGRRVYVKSKNLSPVLGGLGTGVVSTSYGIKTVKDCIKENVGGEYICQVW